MRKKIFKWGLIPLSVFIFFGCNGPSNKTQPRDGAQAQPLSPVPTYDTSVHFSIVDYSRYDISPELKFVLTNHSGWDLHNLVVVQEGDPPIRSVDEMLPLLQKDSDESTALAIWDFVRRNKNHWTPPYPAAFIDNPAEYLLVYGYGFCGDTATAINYLGLSLGLPGRVNIIVPPPEYPPDGHAVSELYYNNSWHLLDGDHEVYFYNGSQIASLDDLHGDSDLVEQTVDSYGLDPILSTGNGMALIYSGSASEDTDQGTNLTSIHDQYGVELKSGEQLTLRRANDSDGFFSAYDEPLQPPLYYVFDISKHFNVTNDSVDIIQSFDLPVSEQKHPWVGIRVEIDDFPESDDSSLSFDVRIPDLMDTITITPTVSRENGKLLLSFRYSDLGIQFPIYTFGLALISPDVDLASKNVTLISTYHMGSLFYPRVQAGPNGFYAYFESEANPTEIDLTPHLSHEVIAPQGDTLPTDLDLSSIVADSNQVAADGNHFARITVKLLDKNCTPLANRKVTATSNRNSDILYSVNTDSSIPHDETDGSGQIDFVVRSLETGASRIQFNLPFEANVLLGEQLIHFN